MSHSATPWTVVCQTPLSMGFSNLEYWSGLPFPSPGDIPDLVIEPMSPVSTALGGGLFTMAPPGKPLKWEIFFFKCYQSICWSLRIHMLLPYFPAPLFLNRRWCVSQLGWNIEKSVCSSPGLFQFLSSCCRKPGRHTLRWQGHTVKQAVSTSSYLEEGCPRGTTISQWIRPEQDIKVEVLSHWEFRIHLLLQQNDPILTSYIDSFHLLKDL